MKIAFVYSAGPRDRVRYACSKGFSLVVVLVLLAGLAWGTAASLRGGAGSVRIARVQLMQAYAYEQAALALAYCQAQLLSPSASRDPKLADPALIRSKSESPVWALHPTWREGRATVTVPVTPPQSGSRLPECFVELQTLPDQPRGLPIHLLTARGFSPDYRADPSSGAAVAGSAVWLQRVLLIEDGGLRARTERRIVNPPLR